MPPTLYNEDVEKTPVPGLANRGLFVLIIGSAPEAEVLKIEKVELGIPEAAYPLNILAVEETGFVDWIDSEDVVWTTGLLICWTTEYPASEELRRVFFCDEFCGWIEGESA